jgi:hypothetical protein
LIRYGASRVTSVSFWIAQPSSAGSSQCSIEKF